MPTPTSKTPASSTVATTTRFDTITRDELARPDSRKWSLNEGTIGAWVAEMDFGTASNVREAILGAVAKDELGYLAPPTWARTTAAASAFFARRYGWAVEPERIHHVADVMGAFDVFVRHFTAPGSPIIVPTPAYMPFLVTKELQGRETIEVPGVIEDNRWTLDFDGIERAFANGPANVVLVNPHNPTGAIYTREELLRLADIVERGGGRVFADEIWAPLTLDGPPHIPYASISAEAARHSVTSTAASKAWNVAGLKSAQIIFTNDDDLEHYRTFGFGVVWGSSILGAFAAEAAYRDSDDWLGEVNGALVENRDLLLALVAEHLPGVRTIVPESTYVAWLDVSALGIEGSPAKFFLDNAGVTLTAGASCGAGFEQYVRIVFATPKPVLEEIIQRMADALASR